MTSSTFYTLKTQLKKYNILKKLFDCSTDIRESERYRQERKDGDEHYRKE